MTLESDPNNTFIGDFSNTGGIIDYPETDGSIEISEVDNQIRDAKQMIYNTLKNCDGEVTATHTELNHVDGAEQNMGIWSKGQTATGLAVAAGDGLDPNNYTLTTGESVTLADGDHFTFQVDEDNIGNSTLTVDGNAAKNLVDKNSVNINTGAFKVNSIIEVVFDFSANVFYVIAGITIPQGSTDTNVTYESSTTNVFTAPVTADFTFELIAGGGGGGRGNAANGGQGGGGGGEYGRVTLGLTIGDEVYCTVGAGGYGQNGAGDGEDGQRTEIYQVSTENRYFVNGGEGGKDGNSSSVGGTGGNGGGTNGPGPFETFARNNGGDGGNGGAGGGLGLGGGGGSGGGASGVGNDGENGDAAAGDGADGSGGATGGVIQGGNGADTTIPLTPSINSGGGGAGGNGKTDTGGGHAGRYGSGGGGGGDSGTGINAYAGNGSGGVVFVWW